MIKKILSNDSFVLGIVLGIISPAILYIILWYAAIAIKNKDFAVIINSSLQLVSIFINMFTLRIYLLKKKADKTGRGILLATIILAIIYFIVNWN